MSSRKEHFWIGAKGGLLDLKHLDAMGQSVWLFLYFLLRQTGINDAGDGVVLYGNPLSRKSISKDTKGWPERKIKDWTARLVKAGYVRAVPAGNDGMIFFVCKAKSKTKNPKPSTLYLPVQCKEEGRKTVRHESQDGRKTVLPQTEKRPTFAINSLTAQSDAHSSTTLTPTSPFNYNNTAAAKTAADSLMFSEKQMHPKTEEPARVGRKAKASAYASRTVKGQVRGTVNENADGDKTRIAPHGAGV